MYELTRQIFSNSKWRNPKVVGSEVLYVSRTARDVKEALEEAVAAGADLEEVYLGSAYLTNARLSGAKLPGAMMGGANLRGANLQGAMLAGARFGQVVGANFSGAWLNNARFTGVQNCDLSGADLSDAWIDRRYDNMLGNNFEGANVRGLSVDYDVMVNIDFTKCRNLGDLVVRQKELVEPADGNYGDYPIPLVLKNWKAIHRAGGPGSIEARSK